METTRTLARDEAPEAKAPPSRADIDKSGLAGLEKALRFSLVTKEAAAADASRDRTPLGKGDFSAALDLVHRAASALRVKEERAREMEAHAETLVQRAVEDIRTAEGRADAAEARARAAEARAQAAEARTKEVEEWIARLSEAIEEEFAQDMISLANRPAL